MAWIAEQCARCGGVLEVDGPRAKCLSCGMEFFDPDRVPEPEPGLLGWLDRGMDYPTVTSGAYVPYFISPGRNGRPLGMGV